jgi:phosphatidylglycerophosphatase C
MDRAIALFDLDKTLTLRDTLFDFILRTVGPVRMGWGFLVLVPEFIRYGIRRISNHTLKERVLAKFFTGWAECDFDRAGSKYAQTRLPYILRPGALDRIRWHHNQGHRVIIVSASIRQWLQDWCEANTVELISTELAVQDGRLTGSYKGRNCHGQEKVRRIKEFIKLDTYDMVYAYGDSNGDKPMLELADVAVYKPFRSSIFTKNSP